MWPILCPVTSDCFLLDSYLCAMPLLLLFTSGFGRADLDYMVCSVSWMGTQPLYRCSYGLVLGCGAHETQIAYNLADVFAIFVQ